MGRVTIDKSKCIGCFTCKRVCYEVFEVGSDGLAKVRSGQEYNTEEAETAAINCPTGAIKIEDDFQIGGGPLSSLFFDMLDYAENSKDDEW